MAQSTGGIRTETYKNRTNIAMIHPWWGWEGPVVMLRANVSFLKSLEVDVNIGNVECSPRFFKWCSKTFFNKFILFWNVVPYHLFYRSLN